MKRTEAEEIVQEFSMKYFPEVIEDFYQREGCFNKNIFTIKSVRSEELYKLGLALALLSNFQ